MGPKQEPTSAAVSGVDGATGEPRRGWLRPSRLLAIGGAIVLVWGITVGLLLGTARSSLFSAEETLGGSRDAVTNLDVDAAATAVSSANADLEEATRALTNPLLAPLLGLPVIGDDLRAVRSLATNGAAVTEAADGAVRFLDEVPGGLAGLAPDDGRFPVERYERLAPIVEEIGITTTKALEEIIATPSSGRFEQVTEARRRVLELLAPVGEQAEAAALLAAELPRFLGSDGSRTYLFGAATPAELRGTGGLIGSVALLQVDDGALEFGTFEASSDLPVLPPDELPPPVPEDAARWGRYGGTGLFLNLNRTADFPSAARAMLAHWERTRGKRLDGMLVVDPFAFEALLELSGPAEVPEYGVTLDADSVVAFVANEAYGRFDDPTERKEVLGEVAAATFERFLAGEAQVAPQAAVSRFADLVDRGHLMAYAVDTSTQAALLAAGVTGGLGDQDAGARGEVVQVALNSGSANKVDFFAERTVELDATLLADGSSQVAMQLTIENRAPSSGQPGYVIGPNNPTLEAGDNLLDVSLYLAPTARFTEVPPPNDRPSFTETALGYPVHDGWVRIASGESAERRYTWRTADAWTVTDDDRIAYDLLFQGQTVIRPTELTIRVGVPAGTELVEPPPGVRVEGDAVTWQGWIRGEDLRLPLRFARPAEQRPVT